MNPLVLDQISLSGQKLIEASAGTGKTYTISHLVLRLIIKAQDQLRPEPLLITEILVVTFTRAATQELKDRIRDILHRAKHYLESLTDTDENLKLIVDQALAEEDREALILRCHRAILMLDDAPVFTIHGFCQRILKDFSFSTGQAIDQTLIEDDQDILRELVQRLWRKICYPLNKSRALLVKQHMKSPDVLLRTVRPVLKSTINDPKISGDAWVQLDKILDALDSNWQKASELWQTESATICGFFSKGIGRSYTKRWVGGWLEALGDYLADEESRYLEWDKSEKFCQSHLDVKLGDKAPKHVLFDVLDDIHAALASLRPLLLAHVRAELMAVLETYQSEQSIVFFDDLIQRLATASHSDELCDAIRQRYPVALIDEFQDTDQWQYTIFQRIYSLQGTCLLMIGDPKQAIYSFRGADIHAYFKARKAVAEDSRFTLMTNHRTIPSLIQQVNAIFSSQSDAFCINDFPEFIQVNAASHQNDDVLSIDGESNSFSVIELKGDDTLKKADAKQMAAEKTAHWIKKLLDEKALINQRSIEPKDIAILVRKGQQADLIKNALNDVGINSVYLSKESVLTSDEAGAFITLIKAMIEPYQTRLIHKALGDSLIAMDAANIHNLSQQAHVFDNLQQRFIKARDLWKKQGFYSGFEYLITEFCLPESLLALKNGERRLTNLHQLSDVFSQLENQHLSFTDQLYLFEKKCAEAKAGDETQKLRLETEANLVEIVTIHKSKGMEYPLVCCPFVFEDSQGPKRQVYTLFNNKTEERELFWQLDDKQKQALSMDELAEDIRLLYVALTRAKCHLSICWGNIKGLDKSALFHLLYHRSTPLKALDTKALWAPFEDLKANILRGDLMNTIVNESDAQSVAQLSTRFMNRSLHTDYHARSYSALIKHDTYLQDNLEDDPDLHKDRDQQANKNTDVEPFQENIFHFPKGSEAGNFMHQVLEDVDFSLEGSALSDIVEHQLDRYNFDQNIWQDVVTTHINTCLEKSLSPIDCSLSELGKHQVLKEMGFQVNAQSVQGGKLKTLLSNYRDTPLDLTFNPINGDFKGFIDLVFCHQDKYYVLDYKSNFLGYETENYDQDSMQEAIEHHVYDLQYLVYQAALQRYLKSRLPNFDYEQHMGGVFYLFLRGMNAEDQAGIYYTKPDAVIVDAFESLFAMGEA